MIYSTVCPAVYELVQSSHELKLPKQNVIDTDELGRHRHTVFIVGTRVKCPYAQECGLLYFCGLNAMSSDRCTSRTQGPY